MSAAMMHGTDWSGQNVAGWWASEKLDGWRAYWTGSQLLTRTGRDYRAPAWFIAGLPKHPLDCELWLGRGHNHDDVNQAIAAGDWNRIQLIAFDVPGMRAEEAIVALGALKVSTVSFQRVESTEEAKAMMRQIVSTGGEGIMLRRPGSPYLTERRTHALLKLKP